ncbi:MAG: hypothetical protein GTO14_11955 [Anaerolineales bacterium]|nr:hypothetical protein [Anaerolineales bacterium]
MVKLSFVRNPVSGRKSRPIGVFAALAAGFDRVAANPILILPTLLLDLFLWFGPHLSIAPLIPQDLSWIGATSSPDPTTSEQIAVLQSFLNELRVRINLLSGLSAIPQGMPFNLRSGTGSLPAGVPSLMAYRLPISNPFGPALTVAMENPYLALLAWIALTIGGTGFGIILHRKIVRQLTPGEELGSGWKAWGRMTLLSLVAYGGGILIVVVTLIVAAFVWQFGDFLGIALLLLGLSVIFWLAVYLIFTAHGIINYDFSLFKAMLESASFVRMNMLSTIGFLFITFGISWVGVEYVWSLPDENSWFTLLALGGYAFVSATLLTAGHVFYRGRRAWFQEVKEAIARQTQEGRDAGGPVT